VLDLIIKGGVKGRAHITGGGFTDNISRVFPKGLGASIYKESWEVPSLFKWIQEVNCVLHVRLSCLSIAILKVMFVINKDRQMDLVIWYLFPLSHVGIRAASAPAYLAIFSLLLFD
jgi:hypothetical protein